MKKGTRVIMSESALENYGEKWRGVVFTITHKANKYMSAKDFFSQGKPEGYHPGYDEGSGCSLYDLQQPTGEELSFSLYDWELEKV